MLGTILAEILSQVIGIVFQVVCYGVGYAFIRIVSFGNVRVYEPDPNAKERRPAWFKEDEDGQWYVTGGATAAIGFIVLLAALVTGVIVYSSASHS